MKMRTTVLSCLVLAALGAGGAAWLLSKHHPAQAYDVAVRFLQLVKAKDLDSAYNLTAKNSLVGRDNVAFQKIVARMCLSTQGDGTTFPLQTNGNRLRRWLNGRDIEMEEVGVEFEGLLCPMTIKLRQGPDKAWKVYFFENHAQ